MNWQSDSGTVAPGTTGGVLKITGAYNQAAAGTLSPVITGTAPGTGFGQLSADGKATLAGTLKVNTGNGFVPSHRGAALRAAVPRPQRHVWHVAGYSGLHGELHRHGGQCGLPVREGMKASPGQRKVRLRGWAPQSSSLT